VFTELAVRRPVSIEDISDEEFAFESLRPRLADYVLNLFCRIDRSFVTLHIDCRKTEGIIILDLVGDLTIGPGHARLRDEATSLLRAGFNEIILNLQRVAKIDAAGLGALILVLRRCRTQGGKAVLSHLNSSNIDSSDRLELDAEFETFHDEQEAINSFFPDRTVHHYDILTFVEQERKRSKANEQERAT
jgi:anti-sigma B factor antagonist